MKSSIFAVIAIALAGCVSPEFYYDTYDKEIDGSYFFAEPQLDVHATISNARGLHGSVQLTAKPDAKAAAAAPQNVDVFLKCGDAVIARTKAEPVDGENYAVFDILNEQLQLDFSKQYVVEVESKSLGTATSDPVSLVSPFAVDSLGCVFDYRNGCEFYAKLQNGSAATHYALNICTYYNGEIFEGQDFISIRGIDANEVQKTGTVGVTKYFYVEGPREDRKEDGKRVYVDSVRVDLVKYSPELTSFALDLMTADETYDDGFADAPKQVLSNMTGGIGFCGSFYVVSRTFYNDVDYGNKLRDERN